MSDLLKNIVEIKKSKSYIAYKKYHSGNILGITKISRWELVHSNFIAWALGADSSHALGFYPTFQFVKALFVIQDYAENTIARKLPPSLVYQLFNDDLITAVSVDREFVITYPEKGSIDILIEITTKDKLTAQERILPIIIENKVDSSESRHQTEVYFEWGERTYADKDQYFEPLYVFLYPQYNNTKQSSQAYIRMTYQDMVDFVLEPCMERCGDIVSINNYKTYLQCLSFQSDNEKGENTMAISKEERDILRAFLKENKNLLCAVLNELKDEVDPAALEAVTETVRDFSKYLFKGNEYGKGPLVLAIVKQYVADHPGVTEADLQKAFPISFGSRPLIRPEKTVPSKERVGKMRVFNECITLDDGTEILVNNQVSKDIMPKILEIAEDLGYNITKI